MTLAPATRTSVYLRALPVHGLKLAGQFIQDLRRRTDNDPSDEALLSALVSLGHTLGLTVTAEGVETVEQAERLTAVGCDAGQGWHLGRPASPDHITRLLATQSRAGSRRSMPPPGLRRRQLGCPATSDCSGLTAPRAGPGSRIEARRQAADRGGCNRRPSSTSMRKVGVVTLRS